MRRRSDSFPGVRLLCGVFLAGSLLAGTAVSEDVEGHTAVEFEVVPLRLDQRANVSVGGEFRVDGVRAVPSSGLADAEFQLGGQKSTSLLASGDCPCQPLFSDGFESGTFGAWSGAVGTASGAQKPRDEGSMSHVSKE